MTLITQPNQPLVFAVRHGLATLKLNGYGADVLTAELLPQGKQAVENLATYLLELKPTKVWASPLKRCQQTAGVIAEKTGLELETNPLLVEYVDGLEESRDEFMLRMERLVTLVRTQPSDEKLCLCTHGTVIAALSHLLTNREFTPFDFFDYPTPAGMRILTADSVKQVTFQVYA